MDITIVTAYYPVKTGKHSIQEYQNWINNFFQCISSPVIFFCSSETYLKIHSNAKSNVQFVQRDYKTWEMMNETQMSKWREFYMIDPEKNIHSPELYAVWAAKQEFVREAIKMRESSYYIWCDAGYFRDIIDCNFKNIGKYLEPSKITCLYIRYIIGAGMLVGDSNAWEIFSNNYLKELNTNICGKEQDIYIKIVNDLNAVILTCPEDYKSDPWFYLSRIFSS